MQVTAVFPGQRNSARSAIERQRNDDFADVLRLCHVAKSRRRLAEGIRSDRWQSVSPFLDPTSDRPHKRLHPGGITAAEVQQVDHVISDVRPELPSLIDAPDVSAPDFYKPPFGGKHGKRFGYESPRQRIQNDMDPAPAVAAITCSAKARERESNTCRIPIKCRSCALHRFRPSQKFQPRPLSPLPKRPSRRRQSQRG